MENLQAIQKIYNVENFASRVKSAFRRNVKKINDSEIGVMQIKYSDENVLHSPYLLWEQRLLFFSSKQLSFEPCEIALYGIGEEKKKDITQTNTETKRIIWTQKNQKLLNASLKIAEEKEMYLIGLVHDTFEIYLTDKSNLDYFGNFNSGGKDMEQISYVDNEICFTTKSTNELPKKRCVVLYNIHQATETFSLLNNESVIEVITTNYFFIKFNNGITCLTPLYKIK